MKRKQSAHRTMRFALFLGITIILVILAATCIKLAIVIKQSTFDGQHQFILQVQHPTTTELLVFTPASSSITDITFSQSFSAKILLKQFALPVDGTVTTATQESPKDFTRSFLFHFRTFHPTITFFDAVRLFLFAQGVLPNNIQQDTLPSVTNNPSAQQKINKDFMDKALYKESVSVAVVNAAGVSGLGSNVALVLSHIGVNVISVTSSQQVSAHSLINYSGESTYTLQRVQQILHFPLEQSATPGVSDITITIGTDAAERFAP